MLMRIRSFLILFTLSLTSSFVYSQKKPLDYTVFDIWKDIHGTVISNNGNFVAYSVKPQEGDAMLILHNMETDSTDTISRAVSPGFTEDNRFLAFIIKPFSNEVKDLRRKKTKVEDLPKDTLGIYDLATGRITKIPRVRFYKIPEKESEWMAYQLEKSPPKASKKKKKKEGRIRDIDNGTTLVIRNLYSGQEFSYDYVTEFLFSKPSKDLLFATTGNDTDIFPGVYLFNLDSADFRTVYASKNGKYKNLTWDENGQQAAFIADLDTTKSRVREYHLYYWRQDLSTATVMINSLNSSIPNNWLVSEYTPPQFSKDGSKLYFGTAPQPILNDTSLLPEEVVNVEVWSWKDGYLQSQQNALLEQERKKSYKAVIHLYDTSVTQVGSLDIPNVIISNNGNSDLVLGLSDVKYRTYSSWEGGAPYQDVYIMNLCDGKSKLVSQRLKSNIRISPQGRYAYWFNNQDSAWHTLSMSSGESFKVVNNKLISFWDEQNDVPDYPIPYGVMGWTEDDKHILIYDRYDIWLCDPENKIKPVNVTKSGRKTNTVFRYVRLDRDEEYIKDLEHLMLHSFNEKTREEGFFELNLMTDKGPEKLLTDDYRFNIVGKAKEAERILFTRESFQEYPNIYYCDRYFKQISKLSDANPQQNDYLWGSAEVVSWTAFDGQKIEGLLYKPENFDSTKRYPMITYFYERMSSNLHDYIPPIANVASIRATFYTSNDYMVFMPDIPYKVGYPGKSAYNAVVSGVRSLIKQGLVDSTKIGIQGHSWGGYQAAYLITATNMFAAAVAGAPVTNMTSAYGGIRWGTGMSRMFQYEKTQSRIGGTLWDKPQLYLENSPLFNANKIETPLLMMHNDKDGAVPWQQGIELFLALRRLDKPVWMLNYNGEDHGLTQRKNQKDYTIRMKQFFDHYLKNELQPEWMLYGISAIEKGIKLRYDLVDEDKVKEE
jgi:dipeptidyl aminopeptidase/acylaminoacyl peptidase